MTTTALKISTLLGDNGDQFELEDGTTMEQLCLQHRGARRLQHSSAHNPGLRGPGKQAWDFSDGSSIVIVGAWWDLGIGQRCYCWDGCGHDQGCPQRTVILTELTRTIRDYERQLGPGSETALWGDFITRAQQVAGVDVRGEEYDERTTFPATEATWWVAAYIYLGRHPEASTDEVFEAASSAVPAA